jgi:uncharacterized membrane protein YkvA (DUF1232 family)
MTEQQEPEETSVARNGVPIPEPGPEPDNLPVAAGEEGAASEASRELKRFWEAVKHLPAYVRLATALVRDPEVPRSAKVVLGIGGGYALSPIDLVPGIIPVVGQMDDIYAMLTALQQSLKRMPDDVAVRHLAAAGIPRAQIDEDLAAVRDLAKFAVVETVKIGGKALGRVSRAAVSFANDQLERRDARRRTTTE